MPTPTPKPKPKSIQDPAFPTDLGEVVAQIEQSSIEPAQLAKQPVNWRRTVTTGALVLDLAISGLKTKYGGLPGGCIVEFYGENSVGKTAFLLELWGSCQRAGGACEFLEPEAKMDASYNAVFGVDTAQEDIRRPSTVAEMEGFIIGPLETVKFGNTSSTKRNLTKAWRPSPEFINYLGVDSLAAFSSEMEMLQGDKMGMKRAKDFSEAFRRIADHISKHNILMACSNQCRISDDSMEPTGGLAVGYYCTVRIGLMRGKDLSKEVSLPGQTKPDKLVYGHEIYFYVLKNHLDASKRRGKLRLLYNYGIDDLGSNLEWLQTHGGLPELKGKTYATAFPHALRWCEENGLEAEVREAVVKRWNELEAQRPVRKEKVRF